MENRGQIHAHDADKARLAPIFERLKRAGARNVQVAKPRGLAGLEGRMDLVLVDAPCSGSGTWRRRPDTKWRLSPQSLERRTHEQDAALDAAVRFVRPGGRLAYITCSLLAEENDARVAALLARSPELRPIEPASVWAAALPQAPARPHLLRHGVQLTPAATATDAFYVALVARE